MGTQQGQQHWRASATAEGRVLGQAWTAGAQTRLRHPGWTHSTQSPPPALLTPGSSRSYFKLRVQSLGEGGSQAVSQLCWQDWDDSRLSSLCSGEIPALQLSPAPSMDGSSSFADFGTRLSTEQGFADPLCTGLGTGLLQPHRVMPKTLEVLLGVCRTPGCDTWSRDQHPDTHLCSEGGGVPSLTHSGGPPKCLGRPPLKVPFSVNFKPVSSRIFY